MCESNKLNKPSTYGYQPKPENRGYQPTSTSLTEGYQPTSSKGTSSTPPSTGSPVHKPKEKS